MRIEGQNLIFIPKFEVGGKVIVSDESSRRGRSRKLDSEYFSTQILRE
jgi:hypothetical protein